MKKKTVGMILGLAVLAVFQAGCGKNKAAEAANESAETEAEGIGETEDASAENEDETEEEPLEQVGVFLPEEESGQWESDGENLKAALEAAGYEVVLEYDSDETQQNRSIQALAEEDPVAMIIAPVNGYELTDTLESVKEKGIPVLAYDNLIMDTDAVKYYATFDRRQMGRMLGEAIVSNLDLEKVREAGESRTIEFLMGSIDDTDALFLYNGLMEVLQEYLTDGTLVCPSGKVSFEDTGILRWSREQAEENLSAILEEFYGESEAPDVICTAFDQAAFGAESVLEASGILPGTENWPMITGVGCEAQAVKDIAAGTMTCTIFMDRQSLAEKCVEMTVTCIQGESLEVNDYEQYDNGIKIIGTCTCETQLINLDNYEDLIEKGYYTAEEVQPEQTFTAGDTEATADENAEAEETDPAEVTEPAKDTEAEVVEETEVQPTPSEEAKKL